MELPGSILNLKQKLDRREAQERSSTRVDSDRVWNDHERWLIEQINRGVIHRKPRRISLGEKTVLDHLSPQETDRLMRSFHTPCRKRQSSVMLVS